MLAVFVVSDATGKTAERMVRSALVQFEDAPVELVRRGNIRTPEQVRAVVEEAAAEHSIILHTLNQFTIIRWFKAKMTNKLSMSKFNRFWQSFCNIFFNKFMG